MMFSVAKPFRPNRSCTPSGIVPGIGRWLVESFGSATREWNDSGEQLIVAYQHVGCGIYRITRTRELNNKTLCDAFALVLAMVALTVCAALLAARGEAVIATSGSMSAAVTVEGFLPGYSDNGLRQLVKACFAEVQVPVTMADEPPAAWQIQVQLEDTYMPRVNTVVHATMLKGKQVIASRWTRTASLDTAPSDVLCRTVSNLTQRLYESDSADSIVLNQSRAGQRSEWSDRYPPAIDR